MRNYKFSKEHEWITYEGNGIIKLGISEHAQESLGDIIYVEMIKSGFSYFKNDIIGSIESVKTASDIYTPITGEIIEFNSNLKDQPELINSAPYGSGWIVKMKIHEEDLNDADFMTYKEYKKFLAP